MKGAILLLLAGMLAVLRGCDSCYEEQIGSCSEDEVGLDSYTLHMSVHPHLDAYWIFNFDSYYNPQPTQSEVRNYFQNNRFSSVKDIFDTITNVLWDSKNLRENVSNKTQKAHRSFFNSQIGFFKHWYVQQPIQTKNKVKSLLSTKYWQIVGGGYVQHDEGCAYYDDIIQNFQLGLRFLQKQFQYRPKVAISADSFGHSQSTLAILAHLGIEGFLVERSDEHILLKNKTEFIWKAKSANGRYYGALPTHIRWAIHGFEDQFIPGDNIYEDLCITKKQYFGNLKAQNAFLKRILKSPHILRYFGHDFQKFDDRSYNVIQTIMKKFSLDKCSKVIGVYGNPTQYFITLMGQVLGNKIKSPAFRSSDIFPIWDYDSGLYWTGYFTTDAYHKKNYRDLGRLLRGTRKFFLPLYVGQPSILKYKKYYQLLEETAEQVSYLQHHDGISGTSKYDVMDELEDRNRQLYEQLADQILGEVFSIEFPLGTDAQYFRCFLGEDCVIPEGAFGDIYLKVLNSDGSSKREPIIVNLPPNEYYLPNCDYEINCFCVQEECPCKLYLLKQLATYSTIRLRKVQRSSLKVNRLTAFEPNDQYSFNSSHFQINYEGSAYFIGYKKVEARPTNRKYQHLSRYGSQSQRDFSIRPGKYALGNDPKTVQDLSSIKQVLTLKSDSFTFFLIIWKRYGMRTLISIARSKPNEWKVQTLSSAQGYSLQDLYLEVASPIKNSNKFTTDSNGWLSVQRQLFKHEDYESFFSPEKQDDINGNTYPATSFVYIQDGNDKVSINLDRPQGVIAYRTGVIWVNFDRLTEDDGKWVYQTAYRSEYQRYTHIVTVKNNNYNERVIQRLYDQPLFIQGNLISSNKRVQQTDINFNIRNQWDSKTNINNIKFNFRPYNDSTILIRLQNLHDEQQITVGLFADKYSPLLTTFYGRTTTFKEIQEMALGGNIKYTQFLKEKWNWRRVIDLENQNKIFNKKFRENITLSPLQIRTFMMKDVNFDDGCITPQQLKYNQQQFLYDIDLEKPQKKRESFTIKLEQEIIKFMRNGDHCNDISPITQQSNLTFKKPENMSSNQIADKFVPHLIDKPVEVKAPKYPQVKVPSYLTGDTTDLFTDNTPNDQALRTINEKVNRLAALSAMEKEILFQNKLALIAKAQKQQ